MEETASCWIDGNGVTTIVFMDELAKVGVYFEELGDGNLGTIACHLLKYRYTVLWLS